MGETPGIAPLGLRAFGAALLAGVLASAVPPQPAGAATPPATARSPDGRALTLTFDDEFDRVGADAGPRWRTTFGDGKDPGVDQRTIASNLEQQLYVDRQYGAQNGLASLNPFRIGEGALHIKADLGPVGKLSGRKYASGMISSLPSFSQRYGYFEARAMTPRGKGLWSAIWLLPADLTWPPEIDILESIGDPHQAYFTAHSAVAQANTVTGQVSDGFHAYAVSWDPKSIVWYVDGRETARQPTPADMTKPMFLVANLAVGGRWPGNPDASTHFPAELAIDYVRIYQFSSPAP